ncbi:MAG: MarR family winged helix-turn-helix transcriptional regulator [Syntrophomonadaceae bacterium]
MTKVIDLIFEIKNKCILNEEEIMGAYRLSPAEYRGLLAISQGETVTCRELSEKMGLSPSRGSRVIFKLIKNGYIKQWASAEDRRCLFVSLDEKGIGVRHRIEQARLECEAQIKSRLSAEEMEFVVNSLNKLIMVL